jgi:hypothetical protein
MAPRHVTEAYRRADAHVARRTREAVESSRNSRSAAHRVYGNQPNGGPATPPRMRDQQEGRILPATVLRDIERVSGDHAVAVKRALAAAGLIAHGARSAARSAQQDRGAMSPLGGAAT